jgi:uncharacterized protein YgiM (DUF1202 family)
MSRSLVFLSSCLIVVTALLVVAQDAAPAADCRPMLEAIYTTATDSCIGKPEGFACNGGAAPQAEPAGAVSNALAPVGALVELVQLQSVYTPPIAPETSTAGLAWLRPAAPLFYTGLIIGEARVQNVTPAGFPPWQSLMVQTGVPSSSCVGAPASALVVQTRQPGQPVPMVINGASLLLNGTVLVQTGENLTLFVALSGQSSLTVFGQSQPLWTGQQISVAYTANDFTRPTALSSAPAPFDPVILHDLPVALFDRPVILPQPGYVTTQGEVNMRSSPSTDAGVIMPVPPNEVISVLGQNPDGRWYHVRLDTGETGWMLAELLTRNLGPITAVYEATPLPPQRYGELGSAARVLAPAGANLREGPDVGFPVVGTLPDGTVIKLLARSPYSAWVKVESGSTTGWVSLLTVQTQAYIDALPVDYSVPLPPPPTRIPGSFGNAFPDPNAPSE